MNGFIWPSDSARAENDELQRVCEYLEQVLDERDELRKLAYIGEHMHEDCSWKFRFAEIRKERDALAAHVERQGEWLSRAERKLAAYVGICSGDKELTDTVLPMVRQTLAASTTSLSRLKAQWQPIETAPKDGTTIIGWCDHGADEYAIDGGYRLTPYGANAEGLSHADDGVNLVQWHEAVDEGEYTIPAWWCVADDYGEIAANPTHWMPLPDGPATGGDIRAAPPRPEESPHE